tara:strand:- start:85 stop:462 length:378 start_codon:yes stop_codon:yes gene_type:complete
MNDRHKVEAIERDEGNPSWIETIPAPNVPKWMFAVLNIKDGQRSRSLGNSNESIVVSNQLEVTPLSGQWWNSLRINQKAEILELVEWLGDNADDYVASSEAMYPGDPPKLKRQLADNHSFGSYRR